MRINDRLRFNGRRWGVYHFAHALEKKVIV